MLALATDFHGQSRNSIDIRNSLERIARAGFSHVHWCHEFSGLYVYSVYEMLQIKEWCAELGLAVKGVHATIGDRSSDMKSYTSPNEYSRLAGVDLIKNRIDMACILNTDAIVLHFNLPWDSIEKDNDCLKTLLPPVFRFFDELEGYCRTHHIKLCIENGGGTAAQCIPVYDTLYGRYPADFLGLCFDTGHAYRHCKDDLLAYPRRYKDRLFMIHANDNYGGEPDEHNIPFEGGFDWEGFAPILAQSAYRFPLLLELLYHEEGDDTAWLKKAFDAGNRLAAMVEHNAGNDN
jgi:sugar phosphate isomerase/epimerase